jgi:hypothetical protein
MPIRKIEHFSCYWGVWEDSDAANSELNRF